MVKKITTAQVFGLPIYKTKINEKSYEKENITKIILNNFNKQKIRNKWSLDSFETNELHHSNMDENNPKFKKPDYSSLMPVYTKIIKDYFNSMNLNKFNFTFEVANYTCMTKGNQMSSHIHAKCDFSAIHYLKFDEKINDSTMFHNKNSYSKFFNYIYPNINKIMVNEDINNSWTFDHFKLATKEDDFLIYPAVLEHSVPKIKSNEPRITIVLNINIV